MNNIKKIGLLLLGIGIISLFSLTARGISNISTSKEPQEVQETSEIVSQVEVSIDFGNGNVTKETMDLKSGQTVFDLLLLLTERENLKIDSQKYDFGVFVKEINGFKSDSEKAWIYFVNGASGDIAADKYGVKSGDKVEWKYITPTY